MNAPRWTVGQKVALFDGWGEVHEATVKRVGKRDVKAAERTFRVSDGRAPGTGYRKSRIEPWNEAEHRPYADAREAKNIVNALQYVQHTPETLRDALPHLRAARAALRGEVTP